MRHAERGTTPGELFQMLYARWNPQPAIEALPLAQACGRVLAHGETSRIAVPTCRVAAMDGIAVQSALFAGGAPSTDRWSRGVEWDYADMGDAFDERFDAVVPIEQVAFEDGVPSFSLDEPIVADSCIRPEGATLKKGRLIAPSRSRLRPVDLCTLALGNVDVVDVLARPKVAFIPTGAELTALGSAPASGQCIDANSLMAGPLLEQMGAEPIMHSIVADVRDALEEALEQALGEADVVLVNGGASKGSEDFNHPLVEQAGELLCHWMAAGPGRPLCVGIVRGKPVIVVPGPPMSAFNVMEYFVREAIGHWYGLGAALPSVRATLTETIKAPEHMMFLERVEVVRDSHGALWATPVFFKEDLVRAMGSSGYFHSPIGTSVHEAGSRVEVKLLSPLATMRGDLVV